MINPFNIFKEENKIYGLEAFLWQSKENVDEVKQTIKELIEQDEELFCNKDVIWEALDVCNLSKKDFDKADWNELINWISDTYEHELWY